MATTWSSANPHLKTVGSVNFDYCLFVFSRFFDLCFWLFGSQNQWWGGQVRCILEGLSYLDKRRGSSLCKSLCIFLFMFSFCVFHFSFYIKFIFNRGISSPIWNILEKYVLKKFVFLLCILLVLLLFEGLFLYFASN